MSRPWNPKCFTTAMLGERLKILYGAALAIMSQLLDQGLAVQVERPLRPPTGMGATTRWYKLTSRKVKGRTPLLPEERMRIV